MSTQTLDGIEGDLDALDALLEERGGDITEEDAEAAVDDWFDELGEARDRKLNGYCRRIQALKANAAAKKQEEGRLAQQRKIDEGNAGWLERRLLSFVQRRGMPIKGKPTRQLETTLFKITETLNGGKQSISILVPPLELPEQLRQDTITITISSEHERIWEEIQDVLVHHGLSASVERTAKPVEDEVRAALAAAEEARAGRDSDAEPLPAEQIFRYVRLEPRGVRLAIR